MSRCHLLGLYMVRPDVPILFAHLAVFNVTGRFVFDQTFVAFTTGEGNGTPLQYSCLENPMDGGTWQAAVHGVARSQTQLSDFTFTFHFHALEKEMATHSNTLAWRIPGTGEPGGCHLWGRTELDTTEATQQQQQHLQVAIY